MFYSTIVCHTKAIVQVLFPILYTCQPGYIHVLNLDFNQMIFENKWNIQNIKLKEV